MKSSDFNKMTGRKLNSLPDNELKSLVKSQANIANRRYQNIKSRTDTNKAGVRSVDKSGGRFSVAGKNRAELLVEAKRIQNFNKMKTGTVRGAVESQEKMEKSFRGTTHKEVAKKEAKEIAAERKREARKAAAAKGKKLSKKQRKSIERQARKEAKQKAKKFISDTEDKIKSFDEEQEKKGTSEPKGSPVNGEGDSFEEAQNKFYEEMRKQEESMNADVWKTVEDSIDEENPFI